MNTEFVNLLTKAINEDKANVNQIRNILIEGTYRFNLKVNRVGFWNLQNDIEQYIKRGINIERYRGNVNPDVHTLTCMCYHYLKVMDGLQGSVEPVSCEDFDEFDREEVTYCPKDSNENSTLSIYTGSNCLIILQQLGYIKQLSNYVWVFKHSKRNHCARFKLLDKGTDCLHCDGDEIYVETPHQLRTKMVTKIEKSDDYEVIVMASCLSMNVDNRSYHIACERIKAQRRLQYKKNRDLFGKGEYDKAVEQADTDYKMCIREARVVKSIGDMDLTSIFMVKNDCYGGRLYHKWSTVRKERREKAILRGELANNKLVEIDLSQCNFYILLETYKKETGNVPTQLLQKAVMCGKLREVIAVMSEGEYSDTICGQEVNINFDEITNFKINKEIKNKLKLFTLKAINCKKGTKAANIMDSALAKIDKDFAKWISRYRIGFRTIAKEGSTKQSMVPFITQQNEVEFMYGILYEHDIPLGNNTVKNTNIRVLKTTTGVIPYCIQQGINFLIPIHDAVVVLEKDIEKVYRALRYCSHIRNYAIPAYKTEYYRKGVEVRNTEAISENIVDESSKLASVFYYDRRNLQYREIARKVHECNRYLNKFFK